MAKTRYEWLLVGLASAAMSCGPSEPTQTSPVASASPAPSETEATTEGPPPKEARPVYDVRVDVILRPVGAMKRTFWLYQPKPLPEELGLVLVAPSNGNLLSGRALSNDDRQEHLPYVRAGFAVMAYTIDGDMPPGISDAKATEAIRAYQASKAGLVNAQLAIDLAFERLPSLSAERVFAAGRDSGGAYALLLGAEEPRVRGVLAYGPTTTLTGDVGVVVAVDRVLPGFGTFVRWSLPENRAPDVKVPVFVYQSAGDEVVRASLTDAYVKSLKRTNDDVTYVRSDVGDHVGAIRAEGIPRGIDWLVEQK